MTGVVRLGDVCSGHDLCSPRTNISASSNVIVNSLGVHRVGDSWETHCLHEGTMAAGSPNVYVNGLPVARIGDTIDCGSTAASGSSNVIIN